MIRRLCIIILALFFFVPVSPVAAAETEDRGVVIYRLQVGGLGSGTTEHEYIELFNNASQDIDVTNWCILFNNDVDDPVACFLPPDSSTKLYIKAQTSALVMSPVLQDWLRLTDITFASDLLFVRLSNIPSTKGSIKVIDAEGEVIDTLGWGSEENVVESEGSAAPSPSAGSGKILQRAAVSEGVLQDTQNNATDFELVDMPLLLVGGGVYEVTQHNMPTEEPPTDIQNSEDPKIHNDAPCDTTAIFINEIVANPAGSDADGGEFVELVNEGTEPVSLTGCTLKTDKLDELILPDISIEPGAFYTVVLNNDLLNDGGAVTFITADNEEVVEYPKLDDDESWSIIEGVWQETTIKTPGAVNQPTPEENDLEETQSLGPCPEGKFRNPETNRCKNIVDTASTLLPCDPGETRNPQTNRCRKLTSITSTLKPCDDGEERNPETNRCRKIQATLSELQPCDDDEERNPETNRCRKVAEVLSGATIEPPAQEAGIHTNLFAFMTLLAVLYGIYEYRLDFENWYVRARERFAKPAK